jgi:hypothetical protein
LIAHEFIATSTESLDRLQTELVVLPFFSDERPLRGAAALIDWRLCGALSRKLMAGHLEGEFGEKGLFTNPPKLQAESLLLVGLGPSECFEAGTAGRACRLIVEALRDAKVSTAAMTLPGRSLGLLTALEALQLWLDAEAEASALEEMAIIEAPEEHRALASLIDGLRRQAESPLD